MYISSLEYITATCQPEIITFSFVSPFLSVLTRKQVRFLRFGSLQNEEHWRSGEGKWAFVLNNQILSNDFECIFTSLKLDSLSVML